MTWFVCIGSWHEWALALDWVQKGRDSPPDPAAPGTSNAAILCRHSTDYKRRANGPPKLPPQFHVAIYLWPSDSGIFQFCHPTHPLLSHSPSMLTENIAFFFFLRKPSNRAHFAPLNSSLS